MSEVIYDEKLWFKVDDCEGLHYFIGNPHTYHGRMCGWCLEQQRSFFISKSSILECSIEAEYWIKGFLSGNEPEPPTDNQGQTDFKSKKYKEWQKAVELFQETGYWHIERSFAQNVRKECSPQKLTKFVLIVRIL